jgi:hypothetical protein
VKGLKDQTDRQSQNRLLLPSVIKPMINQNEDFFDSIGQSRRLGDVTFMSAYPPITDMTVLIANWNDGPCVDGSELARTFFTGAALVGAAMCSAFGCGSHDRWP